VPSFEKKGVKGKAEEQRAQHNLRLKEDNKRRGEQRGGKEKGSEKPNEHRTSKPKRKGAAASDLKKTSKKKEKGE